MRPRTPTVAECRTCNLGVVPAALREIVALHRLTHRRADHRREQWRLYKQRIRSGGAAVGALHELSCTGPHLGNTRCTPIPVFRR